MPCGKRGAPSDLLVQHVVGHHGRQVSSNVMRCDCGEYRSDFIHFFRHFKAAHLVLSYNCSVCSEVHGDYQQAVAHQMRLNHDSS